MHTSLFTEELSWDLLVVPRSDSDTTIGPLFFRRGTHSRHRARIPGESRTKEDFSPDSWGLETDSLVLIFFCFLGLQISEPNVFNLGHSYRCITLTLGNTMISAASSSPSL